MSLRLHAVLKKFITSASRSSTSPTHERIARKFRFGSGAPRPQEARLLARTDETELFPFFLLPGAEYAFYGSAKGLGGLWPPGSLDRNPNTKPSVY